MGRLNRYILKNAAISIGGLVIFACCVLLLERLLRIFEIVSNSTNPGGDASRMIVNLLPYYLGMAVPIALLLGTIITIDRLSKSSELTAALGAGVSLFHMTKPFLLLAIFLSGLTMFVEGYLQPVGRYKYRQTADLVKQQSFTAALREGTFTKVDKQTFFAGTDGKDGEIGPIFIYHEGKDVDGLKNYRITTAGIGEINVLDNYPVLNLAKSQAFPIMDNTLSGQGSADETSVPFGLNYGRNPSSAGIFVGVVFLVSLQKALEFGQSLGAAGKIPPWLGIWSIMLVVAIFAFFLFWKSAYKMGQPPLTSFSHWVGHIKGEMISGLQHLFGRKRLERDV